MLQIVCDQCGKKYRVDESKIKGESARIRCKACDHIITVTKSKPESMPEPEPAPRKPEPAPREAVFETPPPPPETMVRVETEAFPAPGEQKVRFGLAAKVITMMLIVSLVPLGLFWGVTLKGSSDRIRVDGEILMAQTAKGLMDHVDEWIDKNVRVLRATASLSGIQSMSRAQQEPILKVIQKEYPWMYLVFTVSPEGMNVARSDNVSLKDYSDRQYYKDIAQGKELSWETLIGKTSKKPALVMAVPIKSGDRFLGVMAMAATIDDISRSVASWRKGDTGFAFLVDEKGKVVSHQVKSYVLKQRNLSNHTLIAAFRAKAQPVTLSFNNEKGQPSLGHVRGNKYGWALAIQQEDKEVFEPLKWVQRFAIILLVITVVVVSLIAWFSSKAVVTPIKKLTDVAERMSLGDLDVKIDIKSKDEIGHLARAIGRMQTSLRLAMGRLRRGRRT